MSDLVRYPVGNTVDRDHINWPTILRSESELSTDDQDKLWPVDVSLDQIMALVWRVKKWKLNGGSSVTADYSSNSFPFITQSIAVTQSLADTDLFPLKESGPGLIAATGEQDLLSRQYDSRYQALVNGGVGARYDAAPISSWIITGDFSETGSSLPSGNGRLLPLIFDAPVLYDPGTKLFSPPFTGMGDIIPIAHSPNGFSLRATFTRNPLTVLSGTGPLNLLAPATLTVIPHIAASFSVPMQLSWGFFFEAIGSSLSGTGSGTFVLEATEFWPYENSLHLPVWDSADGSQVNDPFS